MMTDLEQRIIAVMHRYRSQKHYRASRDAKVSRYAVFSGGVALTEPKPYAESKADCERLIARDIAAMFRP